MALRMQSSGSSAEPMSLGVDHSSALVEAVQGHIVRSAPNTISDAKAGLVDFTATDNADLTGHPLPYAGKRAFDLAVTVPVFLFLLPLLALTWLAVRLTSRGSAIYWSDRVGKGGKVFKMPKFRTMLVDAPVMPREELDPQHNHDTIIGTFLRRSSIDELPQLWSILKGEMSLIGPRPLLPVDPGVAARRLFPKSLTVAPGLSGLAQIKGRNTVAPRRKARLDSFYAKNANLVMDLKLALTTLGIVVRRAGIR